MQQSYQNDSMEILISDLIFKLGKANQQIHQLTIRVSQLEFLLQNQLANSSSDSRPIIERKMMAQ
ncbi:hypothetical protein [Bacillus niameyensis]|uniref:hypothetical protein n=1 Tax=Bacillus niameyensis TaxID=1522308 RepID=UPI0007850C4D|nr:hypothetical protein [Bacillus niameyensis]